MKNDWITAAATDGRNSEKNGSSQELNRLGDFCCNPLICRGFVLYFVMLVVLAGWSLVKMVRGLAMKLRISTLLVVAVVCLAVLFVSCRRVTVGSGPGPGVGHGPPPHAPAHGHRHKYHGVELVYDSGRGVYVVVGFPVHFYSKGWFYRFREPNWEVSVKIDGPWEAVSDESLPPGLRGKGKGKGKAKGHK